MRLLLFVIWLSGLLASTLATANCEDLFNQKLFDALTKLELTGPNDQKFRLVREETDDLDETGYLFSVAHTVTGVRVGSVIRSADSSRFPFVYRGAASIKLKREYRRHGMGIEIYRTLFEIAPIGTKLEIENGNIHSTDRLDLAFQMVFSSKEFASARKAGEKSAFDYMNSKLTEYIQNTAPHALGPLWGNLLYKAGWRNLSVRIDNIAMLPIDQWSLVYRIYVFTGEKI